MQNPLKKIQKIWKHKAVYSTWESMPDHLLFLLFALSSLPAFYWGYVVKELWPTYLDAVNSTGFTLMGLIMTVIMLGLLSQSIFFGCIAKRTGGLVYDRWFK